MIAVAHGVVETAWGRTGRGRSGGDQGRMGPVGVALETFRGISWIRGVMVGIGCRGTPPGFVGMGSFLVAGIAGGGRQSAGVIRAVALGALGKTSCASGGRLGTQHSVLIWGLPSDRMASGDVAFETTHFGDSTRSSRI